MAVSFKKKNKRGAASRQRSRRPLDRENDVSTLGTNDDAVDVEQIQRNIEELREDQRLRAQALKEEVTNQKKAEVSKETKLTNPYGLHEDGSTNQKLLTLLDGQFTGQSVTTDKDQHEELMNKFIEERSQKKRKSTTLEEEEEEINVDNAAKALKSAEDKLFELPDHLKPHVSSGIKSYEDGTEGGMLMGNAGIAEVELPTSYTEKTEKETRKALETSKGEGVKLDAVGGLASSRLPANFSVDFNRHRIDYVAEMKTLNKGMEGILLPIAVRVGG